VGILVAGRACAHDNQAIKSRLLKLSSPNLINLNRIMVDFDPAGFKETDTRYRHWKFHHIATFSETDTIYRHWKFQQIAIFSENRSGTIFLVSGSQDCI